MSFSDKKIWVLMFGLFVVIGFVGYVVFFDNNQLADKVSSTIDREFSVDESKGDRPLVVNEFVGFDTPKELVDEEIKTDKDKKVYLKGELVELGAKKIKIKTSSELVEVYIPTEFGLRCEPEFFTDKKGQQVPANQVFLDYSSLNLDKQAQVAGQSITETLQTGDEVIVIAETSSDGQLRVVMLVGYGCEVPRGLDL